MHACVAIVMVGAHRRCYDSGWVADRGRYKWRGPSLMLQRLPRYRGGREVPPLVAGSSSLRPTACVHHACYLRNGRRSVGRLSWCSHASTRVLDVHQQLVNTWCAASRDEAGTVYMESDTVR